MAFCLHGLAVSPGIAIGRAHLVSHAVLEVAHYQVREKDVEAEVSRFDEAPDFQVPATTVTVPASTFVLPPMAVTLPAGAFGPGFPAADPPR